MTTPTDHRELVHQARGTHPFSLDRQGHHALILKLADALEAALDQEARLAVRESDEAALRRNLDDFGRVSLLVWADWLDDQGRAAEAEGMRWLAQKGKWPGSLHGKYRWAEDRHGFGDSASWCLSPEVMAAMRSLPQAAERGCKAWESLTVSGALLAGARAVAAFQVAKASLPKPQQPETDPFGEGPPEDYEGWDDTVESAYGAEVQPDGEEEAPLF